MDKENNIVMGDHNLLIALAGIVSALGLKEIWNIWKKRMDISAKKEERADGLSLKVIEELKDKISALELKIDVLITENTELRSYHLLQELSGQVIATVKISIKSLIK